MFFEFPMGGGGGGRQRTFNLGDFGGGGGFPGGFSFGGGGGGFPGGFEMGGFPMMSPMRMITAKHGWLLELPYKSCLYDILGICRDASDKEISRAYKKLAVKWHPDNNREREEEASIQFDIVNKAYEFLKNKKTRSMYDKSRDDILRKQEENTLSSEFSIGDRIALHSLTTTSYNGLVGTIDGSFDMTRRRWPVKLDNGEVKSFKAANIRFVSRLKRDDRIILHSLTAASYNGKRGTIDGFNSDRGRWTVILDDGSTKTFKPRNMHYISEYKKGDRVVLHHLSTVTLNGKIGTIDKPFLTRRARWSVRLEDGSCRNVKASNLHVATESDEEDVKAAEAAKATKEGSGEMEVEDLTKPESEPESKPESKPDLGEMDVEEGVSEGAGDKKTEPEDEEYIVI